jgi:hypothetical protein
MKKAFATISVTVALLSALALPAQAATPVAAGATCKTNAAVSVVKNKVITNQSTTFTCKKVGKKLLWDKGVVNLKVKTLLSVSQVWSGSSVALSLLNSKGALCQTLVVGDECYGFYLGWSANFEDSSRTITSANETSTIAGLQPGDRGAFQLMYQENPGPNGSAPIVVKQFPFNYDY